ncbi:beta-ketoacyl synthase N-terminal-like domain-containing protein [Variovorax sp. J22R133]|uniref:beta-ketoacyl synthase N-terminal-like domain-containing protein n=1 Tax=Variovorax brevis TaxID=3053503 RepID=UPI002578F967|nr:beta-ketoacyl synthase N-terminal-like domain-containing protein [Variovorax sp. J22R133]MDM0115337.1 beta-ketoacyl synthase N-terminal-like domain-containing protein [Variovorax sp. J22R133]
MNFPVYVAGTGLACALGRDLPASLAALRHGGVSPTRITVAEGFTWPVFELPHDEGDWLQRLRRTVRDVVAQCALPDDAATSGMPLFVASSSLDVGYEEEVHCFAGDVQTFGDVVAEAIGWRGPVFTVSTACTSAVNAMLAAADLIRCGAAAQALVLGVEFRNRLTLAGFGGMQLLSPERALPFGAERNGLVLGEAVAGVVLSATKARWRLAGGANVVGGATPTGADMDAVVAVCQAALLQGGLRVQDIDLIKPQAAGSPGNDAIEAAALRQLWSEMPPMVALKQWIGHTLGAAGAAELVLLTACIETGTWPAADHALDSALDVALCNRAPARLRHILFNAIGFGGGHAALVLEDCGG